METFCLIKLVCPFCYEDSFAQIQKVRNHCQRRHDILLPSRHRADQPPKNSKKYDKDLHEAYPSIPVKLGCPCCSALLSDKLTLITHVVKEHNIPLITHSLKT
ncbi:hypothetical protein BC941DRAFT_194291 [Chlamydoabsidia padenii]|nr:hypothetical protein BC941DRAFT_194291 [Chlamydoabsidia padenii]